MDEAPAKMVDGRPVASHARAMNAMRALLTAFAVLLGSLPLGATAARAGNYSFYNDPLVFGMTPQQVESVVQAPLIYLSGPRGSERYMIERMSSVRGIYPVDTRIVLQFRRGRLTGWRRDWQMRPYWF
jgi:hypothetical protein